PVRPYPRCRVDRKLLSFRSLSPLPPAAVFQLSLTPRRHADRHVGRGEAEPDDGRHLARRRTQAGAVQTPLWFAHVRTPDPIGPAALALHLDDGERCAVRVGDYGEPTLRNVNR